LPVGDDQGRSIDERLEALVRAHHHQDRDVHGRNPPTRARPNHRADGIHGLGDHDGIEGSIEDANARH
jgi:hypothetical protein